MVHARPRLVKTKNWRTLIRVVDPAEQSCPEPRKVAKVIKVVQAVTRAGGRGCGGGKIGEVHYRQAVRVGGGKNVGGNGGSGKNVFHDEDDDTEADGGIVRETMAEMVEKSNV